MADDAWVELRPPHLDRPQRTYIVLGAPRGGTSLMAGLLRIFGTYMGENLGHQHEDRVFRRDTPLKEKIAAILERNATYDVWGWKMPNTIHYIGDVLEHVRNPHFIVVFRNPLAIAKSSSERDGRPFTMQLVKVPINHYAKMNAFLLEDGNPVAFSSFESADKDKHRLLFGLSDFLGVQPTREQLETAFQFFNPGRGYRKFDSGVTTGSGVPARHNIEKAPRPLRPQRPGVVVPERGVVRRLVSRFRRPQSTATSQTPSASGQPGRIVQRHRRSERLRQTGLSPFIDTPFFEELRERWPMTPTLTRPASQLCTGGQIEEPDFARLWRDLKLPEPVRWHRKQWEIIWIVRCLESVGLLAPGKRGLGFGVGTERLSSYFVKKGCSVVGTDLPVDHPRVGNWARTSQHAAGKEAMFVESIVDRVIFDEQAAFRPVDMNAIPADLREFDFCWSACCLEHLGDLEKGLQFIRSSLDCLKPGGVAVHTTEFNLGSATRTLEDGPAVVYREADICRFIDSLRKEGVETEVTLNPGNHPLDRFVDAYRTGDVHLRIYVRNQVLATSLGLFLRKREG